jgi:hypothetical protein
MMAVNFLSGLLLSLCSTLALADSARPAPIQIDTGWRQPLGPYIQVLRDPTGGKGIAGARHADAQDDFHPANIELPSQARGQGATWAQLDFANPGALSRVRWLHVDWPAQSPCVLYLVKNGDAARPIAARSLSSRYFVFPIELGPGESLRAYLLITDQSAAMPDLTLWHPAWFTDAVSFHPLVRDLSSGGAKIALLFAFFAWRMQGRISIQRIGRGV